MNTKYLSKSDRRAAKKLMRSRYWSYAKGKIEETRNDRDNMRRRLNTATKNIATLHAQLKELMSSKTQSTAPQGNLIVDDPSTAVDVSNDPEAREKTMQSMESIEEVVEKYA